MPKLRLSHWFSLLFIGIFLFIIAGIGLIVILPQPLTITETVGEASIRFETPDHVIFSELDCYQVSWQVDRIQGVYLNDDGKVGQGTSDLCYSETSRAILRVILLDGSEETYRIDMIVIQQTPEFWIALIVAVISLVFGLYFLINSFVAEQLHGMTATLKALRQLIIVTGISIVTVVLIAEIGLRFYFTNYGTESERINYVYTTEQIQQHTAQFTGTPNVLYVPNPEYEGHNILGYRGASFDVEKSEGVYRIVAVGESTTYGFGVRADQAYPAILERELKQTYGYEHVEVINAGVIGYTSYEVLTNFQFRVLELDPDLIIYYGALNDADSRFEDPGCYNSPSPMYGLSAKLGLWGTAFGELPASVMYRYIAINLGFLKIPGGLDFALEEIPVTELCLSNVSYTEDELLDLNLPTFAERNFRNLLVLADYYDIDVMVSEFIHPTTREQVNDNTDLLMSPARQRAVDEIDVLYRQLAEEFEAYYYLLGDDFVIEPEDFWTVVHMRPNGTEKQAKLYAQFLVDNQIIPSR